MYGYLAVYPTTLSLAFLLVAALMCFCLLQHDWDKTILQTTLTFSTLPSPNTSFTANILSYSRRRYDMTVLVTIQSRKNCIAFTLGTFIAVPHARRRFRVCEARTRTDLTDFDCSCFGYMVNSIEDDFFYVYVSFKGQNIFLPLLSQIKALYQCRYSYSL